MEVDQTITLQLLKLINKGGKDKSTVNIFNIENVNVGETPDQEKFLMDLLKTLPEPKMKNLKMIVYMTVLRFCNGNNRNAAAWLGVSKDTMSKLSQKQIAEGKS